MQMLAKENIPVIISDDAHATKQLGLNFEKTQQMAEECGIKTFKRPENLQEKKQVFFVKTSAGR